MKKAIVLILAVLYMGTSSGATISLHYCMDKLVDWSFGSSKHHTCDNCGMEMNGSDNGCCREEQKQVKIEKDQKVAEAAIQSMQIVAIAIPVTYIHLNTTPLVNVVREHPAAHAPPHGTTVPPNILHCVFRI